MRFQILPNTQTNHGDHHFPKKSNFTFPKYQISPQSSLRKNKTKKEKSANTN